MPQAVATACGIVVSGVRPSAAFFFTEPGVRY